MENTTSTSKEKCWKAIGLACVEQIGLNLIFLLLSWKGSWHKGSSTEYRKVSCSHKGWVRASNGSCYTQHSPLEPLQMHCLFCQASLPKAKESCHLPPISCLLGSRIVARPGVQKRKALGRSWSSTWAHSCLFSLLLWLPVFPAGITQVTYFPCAQASLSWAPVPLSGAH